MLYGVLEKTFVDESEAEILFSVRLVPIVRAILLDDERELSTDEQVDAEATVSAYESFLEHYFEPELPGYTSYHVVRLDHVPDSEDDIGDYEEVMD